MTVTESARTAAFAGFLGLGDAILIGDQVRIDVRNGTALAGAVRSPRSFAIVSASWSDEMSGLGPTDIGRRFAASPEPARVAEHAALQAGLLEVWLMPVVSFSFDYLITPAGESPPASEG
jgi:hypothetical protein